MRSSRQDRSFAINNGAVAMKVRFIQRRRRLPRRRADSGFAVACVSRESRRQGYIITAVNELGARAVEYTPRLARNEGAWWKRLNIQAPCRWNLRRLRPGFTVDLGCGLGRNLVHIGGNGVGIDRNPFSVEVARSRDSAAFLPGEFDNSASTTSPSALAERPSARPFPENVPVAKAPTPRQSARAERIQRRDRAPRRNRA